MKTINTSAFLSLIIIFFFTAFVHAQPNNGRGHQMMKEKLNLTETQEKQIETLRTEHQKNMIDLRSKLEKARIEAKEVIKKDDFTRSEYLATHDRLSKIQNEIHTAAANHRMDVLEVLNKDQRKTFLEFGNRFDGKGKPFIDKGCCGDGPRGSGFYKHRNSICN